MTAAVPKLKWAFPIEPAYSWFESFENHFSSPDLVFIEETEDDKPNAYALSSPHFSELEDVSDVFERAISLKAVMDGALYLKHGRNFRPFPLTDVVDLDSDRRLHNTGAEYELIAEPFSPASAAWIPSWRSGASPFSSFVPKMLWMAREDKTSRGLLQFLGIHGCTWISLYAVLDFMKTEGLSIKRVAELANSTETEIKRFTHTANNFSAIGPLCRHGDLGQQAPNTPMRLAEAVSLLIPAALTFMVQRVSDLGLQQRWETAQS